MIQRSDSHESTGNDPAGLTPWTPMADYSFVTIWRHHAPIEAVLAREQLETEIEVPILEELLDLDRIHRSTSVTERAPALYSTSAQA